jgi:uncharacterized membrane protein
MTSLAPSTRLRGPDILRGAIMVLMAIDHVRVYSGVPAGGPDPGVFFTRWITHFCAPGFVFFAGAAAFLYGNKTGDKAVLTRFLLVRGAMLLLLELTFIRLCWTFNFDYGSFLLAGVIWMLGWCMILLAALIRLRPLTVGIIGLAIIAFQQLFKWPPQALPASIRPAIGHLWEFIYPAGFDAPHGITILYVLVPWIGVMAAGYGFGAILLKEPARRNRLCLSIGLSATALFLVAGTLLILLQPAPPEPAPFLYRLLGQTKYPASQLYLLMTLGPLIALLPAADKAQGALARILTVFGRTPLFYYLLHIPLIHLSALIVNFVRTGAAHQDWYATAPYVFIPPPQRWGLPLLYLVWAVVVTLLFFVCRRYARYKAGHPEKKWLKYL